MISHNLLVIKCMIRLAEVVKKGQLWQHYLEALKDSSAQ